MDNHRVLDVSFKAMYGEFKNTTFHFKTTCPRDKMDVQQTVIKQASEKVVTRILSLQRLFKSGSSVQNISEKVVTCILSLQRLFK